MTLSTQVKTIPDRFSGLMGYLAAFRFPLLEEIRTEMSANLADSLSSGSHFPIDKIRALPVRRDKSGVQTSPSRGTASLSVVAAAVGPVISRAPATSSCSRTRRRGAAGRPTSRATAARAVSRTSCMSPTVRVGDAALGVRHQRAGTSKLNHFCRRHARHGECSAQWRT